MIFIVLQLSSTELYMREREDINIMRVSGGGKLLRVNTIVKEKLEHRDETKRGR